MQCYCLSTTLFHDDVAKGAAQFAKDNLDKILRILAIAKILKPRFIRLLPAKIGNRAGVPDSIDWLQQNALWLFDQYRAAITLIHGQGFEATIENEVYGCIFGNPREIVRFFEILDCKDTVSFTWDIQNLWQSGTFPSMDVYRMLKPLINYVHVKGGISDPLTHD